MKDLKDLVSESLINESIEKVFNEMFGFYFDGLEDELFDDDEKEDAATFIANATSLINQFLKDNNIKSAKDIKIESSEDAFDFVNDEFYPDFDVVESTDEEFAKEAHRGFMGPADVWFEDCQSWHYDKKTKTLYMSSQCGSYMNGDYFDAKFTKA